MNTKGHSYPESMILQAVYFKLRFASGWWRQLKRQEKYGSVLRYSLIVSIETPENTVDIYTPIAIKVAQENLVKVQADF